MSGPSRSRTVPVLAVVVVAAVVLTVAVPVVTDDEEPARKTAADVKFVEPVPNGSQELWPFTSRGKRFETATLPINLVFRTDATTTRYLLTRDGDRNWENHTDRYAENTTVSLGGSNDSSGAASPTAAPDTATPPTAPPGEPNGTTANATTANETTTASPNGTTANATTANATTANGTATAGPNATTANGTETDTATPTAGSSRPAPVIVVNGSELGWRQTHGGTRYTYVRTADGGGEWLDATYQLHDGDYFGGRTHLRLYEGGSEGREWTAIQAHHEHWDWFGLRHSVGSLSTSQHQLERQFYDKRYVTSISRDRYANGGALDHDGWVSVIGFRDHVVVPPRLFLLPLFGLAVSQRAASALSAAERDARQLWETDRVTRFHVGLFLAVAALPLVVRGGAIAVERAYPTVSPFIVGGPFYLLLVLGLPAAAGLLSRPLDPVDAFMLTAVALGTGIMADYAVIGVTLIEFGVVLHRVAVLVALGTLAAASAAAPADDWRQSLLAVGLFAWAAVVLGPVLGLG